MQKRPEISDLIELYNSAETVDQELFADQRSNLLLVSGDHYNKKGSRYWNNIRESKDLQPEQKLRLTKNHVGKIMGDYVNNFVTYSPSVVAVPNNEKENQDVKAAELNNSVIQYAKVQLKMSNRIIEFAEDYCNIGEVACKLFFDPYAGSLASEEPVVDELGQPVMEGEGENAKQKVAYKFTGAILAERIYGFNLLRHPAAKRMVGEHYPLIHRKMVANKDLKLLVGDDPKKLSMITEGEDKTYQIFDAGSNSYLAVRDQSMVLEFFYPVCPDYPKGYFFITTMTGILFEGELPFGIWPIIYAGFDSVQTSPRHRSKIKQLRPYQAEINRTASKIAEHQITTGDTKLLVQSTSQISSGVQLPGVRTIRWTGSKPEYLEGQTGAQYVDYMNSQITEMYRVANVEELKEDKEPQGDMIVNLYRNLKQKKKFSIHIQKFETFLTEFWETYLELARNYFSEDMLIPMVGSTEVVNISEFKNTEKLCYQIKIEPQVEDLESQMGRTAMLTHILQYVGPNLDPKAIGQIIKQLPFGNWKKAFGELTLDEDMANNMILGLDRGQVPLPNKYDDHLYMLRRLVDRVRQADFKQLDPRIQKNYDTMILFYQKMETEKQRRILAGQKGYIPSGGARVGIDYYVPKAGEPSKTERAKVPAEAVDWLLKRLAEQGSSQEQLQQVNQEAVAGIADSLDQQQGAELAVSKIPDMAAMAPNIGQTNPGGPYAN